MESFPTVHDLAAASEEEVNAHWAGLGFYRRARLLHRGAKCVVEELDGKIPRTVEALKKIDGIGPYTACAIASIAFDVCVPVVDGNVCRVLSRLRAVANHIKSPALKDKAGWYLAKQLVEAGNGTNAGSVNQALMELGATYCAPSGSGVDPDDPLRSYYWSTRLNREYVANTVVPSSPFNNEISKKKRKFPDKKQRKSICELCDPNGIEIVLAKLQEDLESADTQGAECGHGAFPLDPPKLKKREEELAVAVLCHKVMGEDWWLFVRRPPEGLLAGQWEFPSVSVPPRNGTTTKNVTFEANNTKQPNKQCHHHALTHHLRDIFAGDAEFWSHPDYLSSREVLESPIQHIFSHVVWQQWIETSSTTGETMPTVEWTTSIGREVRWMRGQDMKKVGITSGVKKILKAVQDHQRATIKAARTSKRARR